MMTKEAGKHSQMKGFSIALLILFVGSLQALTANAQSIHASVHPAFLEQDVSTPLVFHVTPQTTDDLVDIVVYEVNATGAIIAGLGYAIDDGMGNDEHAGDGRYTLTTTVMATALDTKYFKAIVTFDGPVAIDSDVLEVNVFEQSINIPQTNVTIIHQDMQEFPLDQIQIRFFDNFSLSMAEAVADFAGGEIISFVPTAQYVAIKVPVATVQELDELIDDINSNFQDISAMRRVQLELHMNNDINLLNSSGNPSRATAFNTVNSDEAWDKIEEYSYSLSFSEVTVGILDTGVDKAHIEFDNAVTFGFDSLGTDSDTTGHGTPIAGIIGAATSFRNDGYDMNGILGGAVDTYGNSMIPYRLSVGALSDIYYEIASIVGDGARVINISAGSVLVDAIPPGSGTTGSVLSQSNFDDMVSFWETNFRSFPGTLFVVSAGNHGALNIDIKDTVPGSLNRFNNVVVVSSTNSDGSYLSAASTLGESINIAAPGKDIHAPIISGTGPLSSIYSSTLLGTSFAAPFISGAAGLLFSIDPSLTPRQVADILEHSSDKDPALDPDGWETA